jgi:mono/diheme cytochrome c family protein
MRRCLPVRGLAGLALLLATSACGPLDDAMVAIFGRSMRDQPSFDPYENTRLPAEGAVSFSSGNFPAAPGRLNVGHPQPMEYTVPDFTQLETLNSNAPVWSEFENTVEPAAESMARGELLFDRYCAICHGADGIGADSPILEKWPALAVYNLAGEVVQAYPDAYIYGMIRVGRGLMPQYGHQISHFDRWNIVNYVRQLQADFSAAQPAAVGGEEG